MSSEYVTPLGKKSVKLTFSLTKEQAGPYPISTESIWCDVEGDYFRVKNIPFFINRLSFDDLIAVEKTKKGGWRIAKIIEESRNSTIWLYFTSWPEGGGVLDQIKLLGCLAEGGIFQGYYAVNVPANVDIGDVYSVIDIAEEQSLLLANYPSLRHKDE